MGIRADPDAARPYNATTQGWINVTWMAAAGGHEAVVRLLLESGIKLNVKSKVMGVTHPSPKRLHSFTSPRQGNPPPFQHSSSSCLLVPSLSAQEFHIPHKWG